MDGYPIATAGILKARFDSGGAPMTEISERRCFVIQPFDKGNYDKRYKETYFPAISSAGYLPYRVDEDPSASIPIEQIERGIKEADCVFADLSVDNPNVWLEVGIAIAHTKDLCLVCSAERKLFPFDVQHRSIIKYDTQNMSDFEGLSKKIRLRLSAIGERSDNLDKIRSEIVSQPTIIHGLKHNDITALGVLAASDDEILDRMTLFNYRKQMGLAGYNSLASNASMNKLAGLGYLKIARECDEYGNDSSVLFLLKPGWDWIIENMHYFSIQERLSDQLIHPRSKPPGRSKETPKSNSDDEIPF